MTDRCLYDMMPSDDLRTTLPPHSATTTIPSDPPITHHGHYLPDNPMPYLAPSVTHQPELLLLHWMISTITSLVEDLQHHPIVQDPIPPMSTFTNTPAYRLFLQLRNTLRHLINTTHDAQRGLNRLQFIPGSPGSPGHYRIDPTLTIPPQQTNFLSAATLPHTTAIPPPTDTPPLIRQLRCRGSVSLPRSSPSHHTITTESHNPSTSDNPRPIPCRSWPSWRTASNSSPAYHMTADTPSSLP